MKMSVMPSGSTTCISCRPHGSWRASRAMATRARAARPGWPRGRGPAATARRETGRRSGPGRRNRPVPAATAPRKDCAAAVFAGYRQADPVAVERQRLLIVRRPEQHPAGQDLHSLVSITRAESGPGFAVGLDGLALHDGVDPARAEGVQRLGGDRHPRGDAHRPGARGGDHPPARLLRRQRRHPW